ncbi:MAG: monosaccharide transporter substrate-binding protein family [Cryobacterium sp.]|nr:monosaccharide transporter substrate-binding protein family [Cryobacterium sp.]
MRILEFLAAEAAPKSVSAVSRATGLPKTSVHGICLALADERMVSRGVDGTFWLGPRIAELAASTWNTERSLRFGLLIPTRSNEYYTTMLDAAEMDVRAAGGELHVLQSNENSDRQREQWMELLDRGVDVLLVDAVDSNAFGDLLELSKRRNVPVLAIGSRMNGVDGSVSSDNTQAGLLAGHLLAARLRGEGDVAIIDGLRKNANADRVAGFKEAVRDYPGLRVVAREHGRNDNTASGRSVAEGVFAAHEDIVGIFAVCDPIAFGVSDYLGDRGASVPIVSVDGRARAVEQITGAGPIIGTAAQDPVRIIRTALGMAMDLAHGKQPAQGAFLIPVRLVTADNAEGYAPWG